MDFYELLSSYYDDIFKSSEEKLEFLSKGLKGYERILDIGAGTGTYSIPLARKGFQVYAVDSDPSMVARMKSKADGLTNHFFGVLGMEDISKIQSKGPFKLAYCIGNTIPHLGTYEQMESFLSQTREGLSTDGELILQTVNYDKILSVMEEKGEFLFPEVELEDDKTFKRKYTLMDGDEGHEEVKILFTGEIDSKVGETILTAVRSNRLMMMVLSAGFSKANIYGNFDMSDYTKDSPAIVIRAKK